MGLLSRIIGPQCPGGFLFGVQVGFALTVLLHSSGRVAVVRAECGWDESHDEGVHPECDTAKYQLYGREGEHISLCGEDDKDTDSDDYHEYWRMDDDSAFDEKEEFLHHVRAAENKHCWRWYEGAISWRVLANGKELVDRWDDDDLITPDEVCCASTARDCCHFRDDAHSHGLEDEVYAAGSVSGLLFLITFALTGFTVLSCCCCKQCPDYAAYAKYRKLFNIEEGQSGHQAPSTIQVSAPMPDTAAPVAGPAQSLEVSPPASLMMQPVKSAAQDQIATPPI